MRYLLFVVTALLFCFSASFMLNAQNNTRKFSLLITNAKKERVVNADVELIDNFGNALKSKTNNEGIASFDIGSWENYTRGKARITSTTNRFFCPISINARLNLLTIEMPEDMVIMAEDPGDLSVFDMKEPTSNTKVSTDKTIYTKAYFPYTQPEFGPYSPACDINPLASVPTYHNRAVESEKTMIDAISESCIGAASEAVNSLVDLTFTTVAIRNKLYAIYQEQMVRVNLTTAKQESEKLVKEDGPKVKAAISDAVEKVKALYEGMEKIAAGPELYVATCIWEGIQKYYVPDDIMKLKKATEAYGKAKDAMGEKLTALKARAALDSAISLKDKKLLTDWSDITENVEKTVAGLNILVAYAGNPRKYFTSFESQATKALQSATSMIGNVTEDCKIINLDKEVKTGIEAGQAALASKRKFVAQMSKEEGKWKDRINEIAGTKPWYPFGKENEIWPSNAMAPLIGIESQWAQLVPYHNERINGQKDVDRLVELLSKLGTICTQTQSAASRINQKIEKYEELYLSGCQAADKCDFSNATIILSQMREMERTACGHFYPRPFNFIKSDNLDKRIARNKEGCKTGVPDEMPIDPSWVSTVLYKVYPDCANGNDPRNTIQDVKVWMYFDGRSISATGGSTMFPIGTHTLKIEVEPREGQQTPNATYLIKRVEWMRCAAGVTQDERPLASATPNAKEVTMRVNIIRNSDKNHCYKAVIYVDKCGGK